MTDSTQGRKKKKITYTASPQGIQKSEKALKRLGFESKINFAKSKFLSRSTITKFFNCQPIQLDSFKRICEALTLDWQEIVQMCEEEQSNRLEINEFSNSDTNEGVEQVQTLFLKLTVLDKQNQVIKAVIILEGNFNSINNNLSVSLQAILREFAGDTIKITDIEEGSIRLIIEGSPEDIEQLLSRFNSGELTEVSGFPVEGVQILSESSDDDESNELNDKWRLVQEIVSQRVDYRNLSGADLSDADLSGANLSGANLSGADLSDADLSGADLSGADLSGANLTGANLSDANLSDANLRGANLMTADLSYANLIAVNLKRANLCYSNLASANLSGANLSGANLSGVNLSGFNLSGFNLSGANLSYGNLIGISLNYSNLRDVNLSGADLSGANLSGANLTGANLSGARIDTQTKIDSKWRLVWEIVTQGAREQDLIGIDLSNADLRRADLSNADLSGADLTGANLSYTDLSGANLTGVKLRGTKLNGVNLSGANLSGAKLGRAKLGGVNLSNADLSNADLSNADLSNADLSGANLSGANLSSANLSGANLMRANLIDAIVEKAQFGASLGLTEEMKIDLKRRGAIFEDSPGDRSGVLNRR
jgi:uncharacterized protein YjbI with pentapeptide repeats/DNA-binding Xre family transcriptional regulator